jgi:hypothetical protein
MDSLLLYLQATNYAQIHLQLSVMTKLLRRHHRKWYNKGLILTYWTTENVYHGLNSRKQSHSRDNSQCPSLLHYITPFFFIK